MKKLMTILMLCIVIGQLHAQKIVEQHLNFSQKNKVVMNIQIADSIRIIAWNKNEVYVKASIDVNDNKDNDKYNVAFDESGNNVSIKSKLEFDKMKGHNHECNCECDTKIFFDVYIPENANFSVETINGNITITGKTAEIIAKTISGYIDLTVPPELKADVKMNTISGTMYTNFDFEAERKNLKHIGGGSINTRINGGGDRSIELETISGDIFFRKS